MHTYTWSWNAWNAWRNKTFNIKLRNLLVLRLPNKSCFVFSIQALHCKTNMSCWNAVEIVVMKWRCHLVAGFFHSHVFQAKNSSYSPSNKEYGVAVPFRYSEGLKLNLQDVFGPSRVSLSCWFIIKLQSCW